MAALTYVLASWHSWYYGMSFGLRAYIDYYPFFFIPLAFTLNAVSRLGKVAIVSLSLITLPINIIQTYQYKNFILHWVDMNRDSYWDLFLKTDSKYRGLLWKGQIPAEAGHGIQLVWRYLCRQIYQKDNLRSVYP